MQECRWCARYAAKQSVHQRSACTKLSKRPGYVGVCLVVLRSDSECGLSLLTRGRLEEHASSRSCK